MPASLRQLRHEVTGRLRNRLTHTITGLPPERREAYARRLDSNPASRALVRGAASWYSRAPVPIAGGGLFHLLYVSTEELTLDHAHAGLIVRGTLELSVQEALKRTLRPGAVFYDVGANVGFFTLLGSRIVGPEGRVVAFDPVPSCARAVARNIELNGMSQAEIRAVAVGAADGRETLMVVGEASWSHMETTRERHRDVREEVEVDVVALDSLVAAGEIPPPDVVKIDTEGAEIAIVEGMRETLAKHGPALICELHDTNARFAELMDAAGYAMTNLDGPEPVREAGAIHVLARPRERGPSD
jgi:FkbM family methyltransferase